MFEVETLKYATLATVSRCGMVYLEPEHLGWKVLVSTWSEKMHEKIIEPYLGMVVDALFIIFDKLLTIIRKSLK